LIKAIKRDESESPLLFLLKAKIEQIHHNLKNELEVKGEEQFAFVGNNKLLSDQLSAVKEEEDKFMEFEQSADRE